MWRRPAIRVVSCALATRLLLWGVVYAAVVVGHAHGHPGLRRMAGHNPLFIALLRWDAAWYVSIVEQGLVFDPGEGSNAAFLPAYPALVALVRLVVRGTAASCLLVSNVCFVGAVFSLWSWVRERAGSSAAERAVLWLLLYPFSFFMHSAYAESLFFLLCTLALHRADRGSWASASVFASLASLTRPQGIFLVFALLAGVFEGRAPGEARFRTFALPFLPVLVLGMYGIYLWITVGTPFAVIRAQRIGWHIAPSLYALEWHTAKDRVGVIFNAFQLLVPPLLAGLSVFAWRRLGAASGVYAALAATVAVAFGADSIGREVLAVVPVFAALSLIHLGPSVRTGLALAGLGLLLCFTLGFAMGRFMG